LPVMASAHDVVVVAPGAGRRTGNVEFLVLSEDTPRFNVSLITMAPGRKGPKAHVHEDEDDAFYVLDGELTFVIGEEEIAAPTGTFVLVPPGVLHTFLNRTATPVRILNIHAPAGFDRRLLGT
jgi:mannose-6-phosphate isomerase-like protein (cupin superfamily)